MHENKKELLFTLLILSIILNVFLYSTRPAHEDIQIMKEKINSLEINNNELRSQAYMDNLTIQTYASQLDLYRHRISELESRQNRTPSGLNGTAFLQAPAVMQRIEYIEDYPFLRKHLIEEGSMMNMTVEIKPGKGRVMVETKPLMGIVFQDTANTAVYVAQNRTGIDLSGSDVIFSIEADSEIPSVDGPSAGALMTLLVISSLTNLDLSDHITMTGTVDRFGHVGEVGGIIEKARAASESGKTLFLIPEENSRLVEYKEWTKNYYGMTVIERAPVVIDAKKYIESDAGISAEYVRTIDDILNRIQ